MIKKYANRIKYIHFKDYHNGKFLPLGEGHQKFGIPTVVDRVVQQATHQVLSPIFEEQFSEFSYDFRPKRSCEMAIIKSLEFLNDGHDWVVDIDLERFFDTVHHDKLMRIIAKIVATPMNVH